LDLLPGEVHVIMGENGAGKSTLNKILSGVYTPDSGQILRDGKPVTLNSPAVAQNLGIALLPQEPSIFPDLDIAENIFMGRQPVRGLGRAITWRNMYQEAQQLLESLGVNLNPRARMGQISVAAQQMVEMARALSLHARILIMDEPTASLTPDEVKDLFRVVRDLQADGVAIVFISHRLEEVFDIGDRITVLRDGQFITTVEKGQTTAEEIIRLMVGRELNALFEREASTAGATRLQVENLQRDGVFHDISFEVRAGEVVGMAGLVGAGRTEVCEGIFGVTSLDGGEVRLDDQPIRIRSPRDAVKLGLAYVPEDRRHHGLLQPTSIAHNITLPVLQQFAKAGWIQRQREQQVAEEYSQRLKLRAARDMEQPVGELSGGNQQKVVLAKWLLTQPKVLILDEPTRGIDIGAKIEVHRLIGELAAQGMAILMVSSELPEILAMSDRILVMREGTITAEFSRAEATQEKIMTAATGQLVAHYEEAP
jgi:rhamnose transport system ATP-binding protein